MQALFDAAAAKQAQLTGSPALLIQSLDLKHIIAEATSSEEHPSLAAAKAAASALAAAHRAVAGEALLASLTLSMAESNAQVSMHIASTQLSRHSRHHFLLQKEAPYHRFWLLQVPNF